MASNALAASFLDDFDDEEEEEEEEERVENGLISAPGEAKNSKDAAAEKANGVGREERLRESFVKLSRSQRFLEAVERIRAFNDKYKDDTPVVREAEEFELMVSANKLCVEIEEEITRLFTLISEVYAERFPELDSHVPQPLDYLRAMKVIGNAKDTTALGLDSILTPAQTMAISMTSSKIDTAELSSSLLDTLIYGSDITFELHGLRTKELLPFVAKRMPRIAPNLVALLGTEVTAQLLALVGGLRKLTTVPANNIQVVGKNSKALHGFAKSASIQHFGVLYNCALVQECMPEHRRKAMRTVCGRVALAARVDNDKNDTQGSAGRAWEEEIRGKLKKWHAPPPGKTLRALPTPQTDTKKKRGGRSRRRFKELYGETEVKKQMNRLEFGREDGEYGDSAMGKSFGMLGKEGSGQLRIQAKAQPQSKGGKQYFQNKPSADASVAKRRSLLNSLDDKPSTTPGSESNVAFDAAQGIQLVNPAAKQRKIEQANQKYFGDLIFSKKK